MRKHEAYNIVYETLPQVTDQKQAHHFLLKYRNRYMPTVRFKDALHKIVKDKARFQSFCRSAYQVQSQVHAYSYKEVEEIVENMSEKQLNKLFDFVLLQKSMYLIKKHKSQLLKGGEKC